MKNRHLFLGYYIRWRMIDESCLIRLLSLSGCTIRFLEPLTEETDDE